MKRGVTVKDQGAAGEAKGGGEIKRCRYTGIVEGIANVRGHTGVKGTDTYILKRPVSRGQE
jgi:hypothetical protein